MFFGWLGWQLTAVFNLSAAELGVDAQPLVMIGICYAVQRESFARKQAKLRAELLL